MVTIKDVAMALHMSVATVSRALSVPDQVSEATRERVLSMVAQMGYRPNVVARSLRRGRAPTVLVLVPNLNPFFIEVYAGIEDAAGELAFTALLANTKGDPALERVYLDQVMGGAAAGSILLTGLLPVAWKQARGDFPPMVVACEPVAEPGYPVIGVDHQAEAFAAVSHLLVLGHRRIAHLAGPTGIVSVALREAGWRDALKAAGLTPAETDLVRGNFGPQTVPSGERATLALLKRAPDLTAVFAGNDELAIGAVRAALATGRRVPEDLSVVGMDDHPALALFQPALTTVRIPRHEIGRQAMLALHRALSGHADAGLRLAGELVIRATTARPQVRG